MCHHHKHLTGQELCLQSNECIFGVEEVMAVVTNLTSACVGLVDDVMGGSAAVSQNKLLATSQLP